jgi:hypothetical protein
MRISVLRLRPAPENILYHNESGCVGDGAECGEEPGIGGASFESQNDRFLFKKT